MKKRDLHTSLVGRYILVDEYAPDSGILGPYKRQQGEIVSAYMGEEYPMIQVLFQDGQLVDMTTSPSLRFWKILTRSNEKSYRLFYERDGIVAAIKQYRFDTKAGLKEAKEYIEEQAFQQGWTRPSR